MNDMMFFSISLLMFITMVSTAIYTYCKIIGCESEDPERYTDVVGIQVSNIRLLLAVQLIVGVVLIFTIGLYVVWR